jgi:hypothetical protein
MTLLHRRTIPAVVAIAALGLSATAPVALASKGADDSVAHRAGDDNGKRHHRGHHHQRGHHHHRGGADDGPNHS